MKTLNCTQATKQQRYRSVKYKLSRDITMTTPTQHTHKKNPHIFLPSTTKYSYKRSKRNMTEILSGNITYSKSHCISEEQECPESGAGLKKTYMDSFHFLLNMEKNRYNSEAKLKEEKERKEKLKTEKSAECDRN